MKTILGPLRDPISKLVALPPRMAEVLDHYQLLGEAYAGFIDGKFICCWGLVPPSFLSNQAYIWLHTEGRIRNNFTFIRQSQFHIWRYLDRYEELIGECTVGNHSAHRWLSWLGAKFGEPKGHLIPFTIRRGKW